QPPTTQPSPLSLHDALPIYLEIVTAKSARAFENGISSRAESGRVCSCIDQPLLGLRYPPRPMRQPAEGQPGRADLAARAVDDCSNGHQRKGVGSAVADLAVNLHSRRRRRQRHRSDDFAGLERRLNLGSVAGKTIKLR